MGIRLSSPIRCSVGTIECICLKFSLSTADCADYYPCEIVRAGTGYKDYTITLPDEIEHICPDYSLYSVNEAFGFLTRGCPNGCPWCIVPHKEGSIRPASLLREFLGDKRRAILLITMYWRRISGWNKSKK